MQNTWPGDLYTCILNDPCDIIFHSIYLHGGLFEEIKILLIPEKLFMLSQQ